MRNKERAWLIPILKEALGKLPQAEVAQRCERANVSWAPVAQPGDLFADAHLMASRGLLDVFISPAGGGEGRKVGLPALPIEFGGRARPGLRSPATAHGRAQRASPCRGWIFTRRDRCAGRAARHRRGRLIARLRGRRRAMSSAACSIVRARGTDAIQVFALPGARAAARRVAVGRHRVRRHLVRVALRRSGAAAHLRHLRCQRRQPVLPLCRALQGCLQAQRRRPRGARVRRIVRQPQGARRPRLRRARGLRAGWPRLQQGRARIAVGRPGRLRAAVGVLFRRRAARAPRPS